MDMTPDKEKYAHFQNWMPVRIYYREEKPFVDWCFIDRERFVRPFFEDTIATRMNDPFTNLFRHQTPLEFLEELSREKPGIEPTGFIFHISRCGSTLVSQMLAALPQNIVISEALPIDAVLRANARAEVRARLVRSVVSALGQKRFPEESKYFIKFDSWSVIELEVVRAAFPDVPWIFVYRNPVEVIVSQMHQRGAQMIPGAIWHLLPEVGMQELMHMSAEEYCARVLAKMFESALPYAEDEKALLVNYEQLPGAITGEILDHFGVAYSDADVRQMKEASRFDAKTPRVAFARDSERKRSDASEIAREMAAKWADPHYERFEAIRLQREKGENR